jgi:hypothetical protein
MGDGFRFERRTMLKGMGASLGLNLVQGRGAVSETSQGSAHRLYEQCITRMEYRGADPPTKKYIDETIQVIKEAGVQAWWFSAVNFKGVPLFPSRAYPRSHPQANREILLYLIDEAHRAGITVMSWYPMGMSRAVTDVHPDWRMRFLDFPWTPDPETEKNYACYNSPYREALYGLCKEIVGDLGFDGIWFDCSTFSNHETGVMFQPACCCDYCRKRFLKDTALEIPTKVDFASRDFRRFVQWRYGVLMEVWRGVVDAVHEASPRATVAFNNYRRRNSDVRLSWNTAIPLRRMDLDAVISSELDGFGGQADIEMKIGRAMGGRKGIETWMGANDYEDMWVPDVEPLNHVQASLGCLSGGGSLAVGVGQNASYVKLLLRKLRTTLEPRIPYLGGEPIPYGAILISQQVMDFDGQMDPDNSWDAAHGANELMQHAHLPTEVVFDDHIDRGDINRFPVLILGNASCVSLAQATKLTQYVSDGGVLIASHQAGEKDELGYGHPQPVLDELLGIQSRAVGPTHGTYEVIDPALKVNESGFITAFGPRTKAIPVKDVRTLLQTHEYEVDHMGTNWPGAWVRTVGKGKVVYFDSDLMPLYLHHPTPAMREFFARLLRVLVLPPVTLSAPFFVNMNLRQKQEGEWLIHLHNFPGPGYRYPNPPNSRQLGPPGEVVPVGPLTIQINHRRVLSARSGLTGEELNVRGGQTITVPRLELHDVVVVRIA